MDKNKHIQTLLDKYWAAETSLAEEKALQQYFEGENIPAEFAAYQSLFVAKSKSQNASLSDDFEANILSQLEEKENVFSIQNATANQTPNIENTVVQTQSAEIKKLRWIAGIAASIALLLAVYIVMPQDTMDGFAFNNEASTLTETEHAAALKAYKQTKSALFFVSEKMNEGAMKAAEGLSKVPNLSETINELE
jgi:hypothetical protein